ncbi:MAG: hypothetical protein JXK05_06515 [Campylobacterales bacterium]|nr:hypothetical protein [Campylobacterales bacterium]
MLFNYTMAPIKEGAPEIVGAVFTNCPISAVGKRLKFIPLVIPPKEKEDYYLKTCYAPTALSPAEFVLAQPWVVDELKNVLGVVIDTTKTVAVFEERTIASDAIRYLPVYLKVKKGARRVVALLEAVPYNKDDVVPPPAPPKLPSKANGELKSGFNQGLPKRAA